MAQRTFRTAAPAAVTLDNGATLIGREWIVQPLLPTPLDTSDQATAYVAANRHVERTARVWLGIKYGQPPIGDLRFRDPEPYAYPAGNHDVFADWPDVPHMTYSGKNRGGPGRTDLGTPTLGSYDFAAMGVRDSEDILHLHVYAPTGTPPAGGWPILFHIHGGAWNVNHVSAPQHLGHRLAAYKGVIVVTPEYRLGRIGNFPISGEAESPSLAYEDMVLALKWTNANIHSFGGDPTRVCVSGTSAGGAATMLFLGDTRPEVQALFHSAYISSGGGIFRYIDQDRYSGYAMLDEAGLRTAAPALPTLAGSEHRRVADAIAADGYAQAVRHAVRPDQMQAMAEIRRIPRADWLNGALYDEPVTGYDPAAVWTYVRSSENPYPYKIPSVSASPREGITLGHITKPFMAVTAGQEAVGLIGPNNLPALRDALLGISTGQLNAYAQRLGYNNFAAWKAASWFPEGGIWEWPSALMRPEYVDDPGDAEYRMLLYGQAIFGYPAWRFSFEAALKAANILTPNSHFWKNKAGWYGDFSLSGPTPALRYEFYANAQGVLTNEPGEAQYVISPSVAVDTARQYRIRGRVHSNGNAGAISIGISCRDDAGNGIGVDTGLAYAADWQSVTLADGWHDISSAIITGEGPDGDTPAVIGAGGAGFRLGTERVSIVALLNANNDSAQIFGLDSFWLEDVTDAESNEAPTAYFAVNNFTSGNYYAGHSSDVHFFLGNVNWNAGPPVYFSEAASNGRGEGLYEPFYMSSLWISEIMQRAVVGLCYNADPNDAPAALYDPFANPATQPPEDVGGLDYAWIAQNLTTPNHANVIGKYFGEDRNNLNAYFTPRSLQRDAHVTYGPWFGWTFADYRARLEP